jgi:hypothetical protein
VARRSASGPALWLGVYLGLVELLGTGRLALGRAGAAETYAGRSMRKTDDTVAYASNWRMVLAFDAALGGVMLLVGAAIVVLGLTNAIVGAVVAIAGAAYVGLVGARARRWLRLRRAANL